MKRVVAMDFNPTAQLLCCVTGDSTVVLIPVYFLMRRRAEANPASLQRERESAAARCHTTRSLLSSHHQPNLTHALVATLRAHRKAGAGAKKDDGKPTSTWYALASRPPFPLAGVRLTELSLSPSLCQVAQLLPLADELRARQRGVAQGKDGQG
jgi:hypothetical protein